MQVALVKRALVQLTSVLVLIIGLSLGYFALATSRAKDKAQYVCAKIQAGVSAVEAAGIVRTLNVSPSLQSISIDHIVIGFDGPVGERWLCDAYLRQGVVVENEVRLVD